MNPISSKAYPHLVRLVSAEEAIAEEEIKIIKLFRHKGQDYSIIEKDPGLLSRKKYIFKIDGESFQNNGKGWPTPEDVMLAIKRYVKDHNKEAVAEANMEYPELEKILAVEMGVAEDGRTIHLDPAKGSKKYRVHVAHDASVYCEVDLMANSPEEAEEQAFELARNGELNWALSEGNPTDDPYLPNDDSIQEVDEIG